MTRLKFYILPIALLAAPLAAEAQGWSRAPRDVFWDGQCRVEQYLNRDGDVVERRRCGSDGNASARAAREADRPEPGRDQVAPRYAELVPQPGSYAASRASAHDEPAAAPVYRALEPVALAPHIIPKIAPAPLAVRTRVVPPAPPAALANTPRIAAKAPVPVAPRVSAKAAPAAAPLLAYKAAPVPKQMRLVAKAAPVALAPRIMAKVVPPVMAPRVIAKAAPAARPVRLAPALPAPRLLAKVPQPPRLAAKVPPAPVAVATARVEPMVETPHVAAKAEVVGKTPGTYPKSDWLVTLPATEQEKAEAVVKALLVPAKAAAGTKPLVAKVEPDWQRHEYREYVLEKSKDRYSNLK